MPKSRHRKGGFVGRKQERRLRQVAAMDTAAQVKILVERLPHQHAYDAFLLQQPDVEKRRKMFEFTKGFCRFPNPTCPSPLDIGSTIIKP